MAGKSAQFTLRLIDKVTGAARQIGASLGLVDKGLGKLSSRDRSLGRFTDNLDKMREANSRVAGAGKGAGGMFGDLLKADLAARAIGFVTGQLIELGKAVLETGAHLVTFGQNSAFAFDQLAKHGATGTQLFAHARAVAVRFGLDLEDTTHAYAQFLKLQFNPRQAENMLKMGADLRALGASAEDVQGIFLALGQIKSKGRLMGQEMLQLAERGVSQGLVQEEIGKALGGKSNKEVQQLQEQGKVSAEVGLKAIEEAIKRKLQEKNLGDAGAKFAENTIDGIKGRFKALAEDTGIDLVNRIAGPITKRLSGGLGKFEAFVDSDEGQQTVEKIAVVIGKAADAAGEFASAFGSGFGEAWSALGEAVKPVLQLFGGTEGDMAREALKSLGKMLGWATAVAIGATGAFLALGAGVVFIGAAILDGASAAATAVGKAIGDIFLWWDNLSARLDSIYGPTLKDKFLGIGKDMVLGLARGITEMLFSPALAMEDVASHAVDAAKRVLGIKSPSRVFIGIGRNTSAGFVRGIDSGNADVLGASQRMADASLGAFEGSGTAMWTAWDTPRSGAQKSFSEYAPVSQPATPLDFGDVARSAGGTTVHFDVDIHVDGAGEKEGRQLGEEIFDGFERKVDAYFRRMQLET